MGIKKAKIPKVTKVFVWPASAEPNASFHPFFQGLQHTIRPNGAFHPLPITGTGFSCLLSPCRHYRRAIFTLVGLHVSTFLRPFARWALPHVFAPMDALTPARPAHNRQPFNGQVSLLHMVQPSLHSVTKHLTRPIIAFLLPAQRDGLPRSCGFRTTRSCLPGFGQPEASLRSRSGLRLESADSSPRTAESCSLSYGLHVRRRLLSTPPHGDAVTFGYRERASPRGGLSPPLLHLLAGARIPARRPE